MIYTTIEGEVYDVSEFSSEGIRLYEWLQRESEEAKSWTVFQQRTSHGVIELGKREMGEKWRDHPLYEIQLDLVARMGIDSGELRASD